MGLLSERWKDWKWFIPVENWNKQKIDKYVNDKVNDEHRDVAKESFLEIPF